MHECNIKDWSQITVNKAKLIYDDVLLEHKATIEVKNMLEDKSFKLFSILVTIGTISVIAFIKQFDSNTLQNIYTILPLGLFCLFNILNIGLLASIFRPKQFYPMGNKHEYLWDQSLLEQKEIYVIYNRSFAYSKLSKHNDIVNKSIKQRLNIAISLVFYSITVSFALWIILKFILIH